MRIKRILVFLIVLIILIDLAYFYPKLTGKATVAYKIEIANVTRVIDGDTIGTSIGEIRLLGINNKEL